jgi:selenocysteine-specific elongation factor
MLAGATGIDIVLFVIAADEGIKPQTREHFDICRLLGIPRGIVVVTKTDLADPELQEILRLEIDEFVAGSFLQNAPVHHVSSVTHEGIPELKTAIAKLAHQVRAKEKGRYFRLPIDRAFTMRGFGAVVTGTVVSGSASLEDELEVHPIGKRVRVRGIQTHGETASQAMAGQRAAINLAGVDTGSLGRGMSLTVPGVFSMTREFGCRLEVLSSAPALQQRQPVHLHIGTGQLEAEVRLLETSEAPPGTSALAKIRISDESAVLALPGDRFILRRFSPLETIAGGIVLDAHLPNANRATIANWLAALESADTSARIVLIVDANPGITRGALVARGGFTDAEIHATPVRAIGDSLITQAGFVNLEKQLVGAVRAYHDANPLAVGMKREELRGRLAVSSAHLFDAVLAASSQLAVQDDLVRLASHQTRLDSKEDAALTSIEEAFLNAGLASPATDEVLRASGVDLQRARAILQILLRSGKLVRITAELVLHESAVRVLKESLAARAGQRFSVTDFKAWTGTSRKYAIPLLEYCDRVRLTRREGEQRLIL